MVGNSLSVLLQVCLSEQTSLERWAGFRCILHLEAQNACIDAASFQNPEGKDVVYAVDLVAFVNSLMFNCTLASMPGSRFVEALCRRLVAGLKVRKRCKRCYIVLMT